MNKESTPLEYKDYIEGTRQILENSKQEKEPYLDLVQLLGGLI